MRIVVLVKEVPDTYAERTLSLTTGLAERDPGSSVLDEVGERAIEAALAHRDAHPDTEVVLLSMTPGFAATNLRKGLAMGADRVVQVVDDDLLGADLLLTAEVLAAGIRRIGADLVIAGNLSTDGAAGVLPAMLAELLGVAQATNLDRLAVGADEVSGVRAIEAGTHDVRAPLPAVVSVTERMPPARFPNFKGILAAKKKPFETVSCADLGVSVENPEAGRSIVTAVAERPARAAGVKIVDDGEGGRQLAAFLAENQLV